MTRSESQPEMTAEDVCDFLNLMDRYEISRSVRGSSPMAVKTLSISR
jgi:hypothetical protein